jgi:hypothetical protein
VEIPDNKLKVFTKQIYNHILDEYGDDFSFFPQYVYTLIRDRRDEILNILTSRLPIDTKRALSFMVSLYSENKNLDEIVKFVKDNYIYMDMIHYDNLDKRLIECDECRGNGTEECDRCSGSGNEDCNECNGNGTITCSDCDGSGEDSEGEPCYRCDGGGEINCPDCDGNGSFTCSDCGGDGTLDCGYCNGSGEINSLNKYFDKYVGFIATISPDVRDFPTDTVLTDEQVNLLFKPKTLHQMDLEDSLVDEYEPMAYKGDGSGSDMWVIEYKDLGF